MGEEDLISEPYLSVDCFDICVPACDVFCPEAFLGVGAVSLHHSSETNEAQSALVLSYACAHLCRRVCLKCRVYMPLGGILS